MYKKLSRQLAEVGLDIGLKIREEIHKLPRHERGGEMESILKQGEESKWSKKADAIGERIGFNILKSLSDKLETKFILVVEPKEGKIYEIGNYTKNKPIYSYFDSIDGTMIVAGLGKDEKKGYRVGNNGCWGVQIAFTDPTSKDISELTPMDFESSAIVDGNPAKYRVYPTNALAYKSEDNIPEVFEKNEIDGKLYPLRTSNQTDITQSTVLYDDFSAYDRFSAPRGAEDLSVKIYQKIMNKNEGGFFDKVRIYGRAGEILRQLLESPPYQPQSTALIALNDHPGNSVPTYSLFVSAGGYYTDLKGNDIGSLKLKDVDRMNLLMTSNSTVRDKVVSMIGNL